MHHPGPQFVSLLQLVHGHGNSKMIRQLLNPLAKLQADKVFLGVLSVLRTPRPRKSISRPDSTSATRPHDSSKRDERGCAFSPSAKAPVSVMSLHHQPKASPCDHRSMKRQGSR